MKNSSLNKRRISLCCCVKLISIISLDSDASICSSGTLQTSFFSFLKTTFQLMRVTNYCLLDSVKTSLQLRQKRPAWLIHKNNCTCDSIATTNTVNEAEPKGFDVVQRQSRTLYNYLLELGRYSVPRERQSDEFTADRCWCHRNSQVISSIAVKFIILFLQTKLF